MNAFVTFCLAMLVFLPLQISFTFHRRSECILQQALLTFAFRVLYCHYTLHRILGLSCRFSISFFDSEVCATKIAFFVKVLSSPSVA